MKVASLALSLVVALVVLVAVESASAQQGMAYSYSWSSNACRTPYQPNCPQQQMNCRPGMNCPPMNQPGMLNPAQCPQVTMNRNLLCPPQYHAMPMMPARCPQQLPWQSAPRGNNLPQVQIHFSR